MIQPARIWNCYEIQPGCMIKIKAAINLASEQLGNYSLIKRHTANLCFSIFSSHWGDHAIGLKFLITWSILFKSICLPATILQLQPGNKKLWIWALNTAGITINVLRLINFVKNHCHKNHLWADHVQGPHSLFITPSWTASVRQWPSRLIWKSECSEEPNHRVWVKEKKQCEADSQTNAWTFVMNK